MPTDRFLIRFDTNVTAAMAALDRLAAKITQIEARLNSLGARASGAASFAGVTAGAQQATAAVSGLSPAVAQATQKLQGIKSGVTPIQNVGTAATAAASSLAALNTRAATNLQLFQKFGNVAAGRAALSGFQQLAAAQAAMGQNSAKATVQANQLQQALSRIPGGLAPVQRSLGDTSNAFARHIRRIEETIFAYAAFFAAVNTLKAGLDLATTVDRESRRLEAVLQIDPQQSQEFVRGLADVAVETVTPLENLISEADFIASAFADIEDPAKRAAASLELVRIVGQLTTVTQRDVATETENVISIMKQAGIPIEQLGDAMGKIVIAGHNSSTAISDVLDALQQTTAAAGLAGIDFNTLVAIIGRFRDITQKSGTEIGNILSTLFQTINNNEAQNNLEELTNGLVKVRDEAGNLRPITEIMANLVAVAEKFPEEFNRAKLDEIFKALAPPLNPRAARDIKILFDVFKDLGPALDNINTANADALVSLVDKINRSLGQQFLKFIEEIKRGFVDLFQPEVLKAGEDVLFLLRSIRDLIAQIPGPVLLVIAKLATLFAVIRAGSFVVRGLVALLGVGGLATAARTAAISGGILAGAITGVRLAAGRLLPVLAAFAAIEFGGQLLDEAQKMDALKEFLNLSEEAAQSALHGPTNDRRLTGIGFSGPIFEADPNESPEIPPELAERFGVGTGGLRARGRINIEGQLQNVQNLAAALHQLNEAGQLTAEVQKKMEAAVLDANIAHNGQLLTVDQLIQAGFALEESNEDQENSWEELLNEYLKASDAMNQLTAEEKILADSQTIQAELADDVSSALEKLSDRLRDGKISFEEYTQGVDQVTRASELAAQLVAAASNELARVPQLAGAAAEGNDALAAAIFRMITSSTDQLPLIDQLISKIVGIAGAAAAAAATAAANPIVIRTIILPPTQVAAGGGIPEGAGDPGLGKPGGNFVRPFVQVGTTSIVADIQNQISSLVNNLIRQLVGGTSGTFGVGPSIGGSSGGGAGTTRRQTDILDIGDLKRSDIPKIIEIATRLRNRIPGARADSKDAIVALLKDARFLQTVKGIDDRLLRLAIERLTGQMEEANRREEEKLRRDQILRNLVVRTGPLGALVSQPTAFGLGGSIAQGNGLNFDPTQGNFVINVPVELKGLEPKKLQQLIYNIISKAIRDALRL